MWRNTACIGSCDQMKANSSRIKSCTESVTGSSICPRSLPSTKPISHRDGPSVPSAEDSRPNIWERSAETGKRVARPKDIGGVCRLQSWGCFHFHNNRPETSSIGISLHRHRRCHPHGTVPASAKQHRGLFHETQQ